MARGKFQILINEGIRLKKENKFKDAIDMFTKAKEEALEKDEELTCLVSMIDCSVNLEDYELAEKLCLKVLLKFGEIEDAYLNLAYIKEQQRQYIDSYRNLQNAYIISKKEVYKENLDSRCLTWEKELWMEYKYNISSLEFKKASENLEDLFCLIAIQGQGEITKEEAYTKYISLLIQTKEYSRIYNLRNRLRSLRISEEDIEELIDEDYFFKKIKASLNDKSIYFMFIDFLLMKEKKSLYYLEKLKLSMEFLDKEYFKCLVEKYLHRTKDEKIKNREKEYKVEMEIYDLAYNYLLNDYEELAKAIQEELSELRKVK